MVVGLETARHLAEQINYPSLLTVSQIIQLKKEPPQHGGQDKSVMVAGATARSKFLRRHLLRAKTKVHRLPRHPAAYVGAVDNKATFLFLEYRRGQGLLEFHPEALKFNLAQSPQYLLQQIPPAPSVCRRSRVSPIGGACGYAAIPLQMDGRVVHGLVLRFPETA